MQTFNACAGRTYKLEVWGAQGGTKINNDTTSGKNYGGYSYGNISLASNKSLYIFVGGKGNISPSEEPATLYGGWNGGGGIQSGAASKYAYGYASGGGATDISLTNSTVTQDSTYYRYTRSTASYNDRIIVAGGGGGSESYRYSTTGGSGGGMTGGNGGSSTDNRGVGGGGGTQSAAGANGSTQGTWYNGYSGSFGQGGYTTNTGTSNWDASINSGAGGGGYYGGGMGGSVGGSGGGGSGYIGNSLLVSAKGITKQMYQYSTGCASSTAIATKTTCTSSTGTHTANAANTGNGYARITYLGT